MKTLRVYKVHIHRHVCSQLDRYDGKHDVFMVEPGFLQAVGGSGGRLILLLSIQAELITFLNSDFKIAARLFIARLMDGEISLITVHLKIELNFYCRLIIKSKFLGRNSNHQTTISDDKD